MRRGESCLTPSRATSSTFGAVKNLTVVVGLSLALGCTPSAAPPPPAAPAVSSVAPSATASAPAPSASSSAVASASAAPAKPTTPPTLDEMTCRDGVLAAWPSVFETGGLGLSGTGLADGGGGAPGIGLGHGAVHKMVGQPVGVDGVRGRSLAEGVCATSVAQKACRVAAQKKGKLEGSIELGLDVDASGKVVSVKRSGGTIAAGEFATCMEGALGAATFEKQASGKATWRVDVTSSQRAIKLKEKDVKVTGALPPEVVRRIVRQKFPLVRGCYEPVVKKDPDAKGAVFVDYVITEKGAVTSLKESGSTLADATARACVAKVFGALAYPEPEGGKVVVHYGIEFAFEID